MPKLWPPTRATEGTAPGQFESSVTPGKDIGSRPKTGGNFDRQTGFEVYFALACFVKFSLIASIVLSKKPSLSVSGFILVCFLTTACAAAPPEQSRQASVAVIEFLPFHSDASLNYEIHRNKELILTAFYRNKMVVVDRTRHPLPTDEAARLLRVIHTLSPDSPATGPLMGHDQLRIVATDGQIRHFLLPDNTEALRLLRKLEAVAQNGKGHAERSAAYAKLERIRPLPTATREKEPLTLTDFETAAAASLRQILDMPLRFVPLTTALHDDLIRSADGHRLFVLKHGQHLHEIRIFPARHHPPEKKPSAKP